MIEIYLLEQFYAFYKYKTLSSAAEHLHLSQPSLSRSMRKLEDKMCIRDRADTFMIQLVFYFMIYNLGFS